LVNTIIFLSGEYMRKYFLAILVIFAVIFVSGCIGEETTSEYSTDVKMTSKGGVVIKYPSDWVVSQSTSNSSIISIADSKSIDSSKIGQVNVNVEKKKLDMPLDTFVNQTNNALNKDPSFDLISSGKVLIGENEAIEVIYTSNSNGSTKMHKVIWIEHKGNVVSILCTAPQEQFDSYANIFNFIINNIELK